MASTARIDELKKKFDENPRRYFAPLANEFRKAGDIEQAIMICEEFLPQQPGHMSGHIVYGQALFEASRFEESRTVFETALTLDRENLIALRHLGDIARGQGDMEAARRWFDRVLEADPRNDEILALIAGLSDAPAGASPAASGDQRYAPPPADDAPPPLPEPFDLDGAGDTTVTMSAIAPPPPPPPRPAESSPVGSAEGLESVEFVPPTGPVDRAHDLGSSLEAGEFVAPASRIEPLPGLEETGVGAFERSIPDGGPPLPMLDTSESAPLELEGDSLPEGRSEIPSELPPSVIAAEAAMMDVGEPIPEPRTDTTAPSPFDASAAAPSAPQTPFVTETMAELFLKQGFRDQALDVFRQLLAINPSDERLQHRVAELQTAGPTATGDSVRDFFARLALRRPGTRAAAAAPPSDDDFTQFGGGEPAPRVHPTPTSVMSTGLERGATTQATGGSIDALFGNRAVGTSEDSAASALAQAFGAATEPAPPITGRPARAAAGELSLDSVFRDAAPRPPRASQNFSFDQFFSPDSAAPDRASVGASAPGSDPSAASQPAERSADDIEQFNSWLQGLKPK